MIPQTGMRIKRLDSSYAGKFAHCSATIVETLSNGAILVHWDMPAPSTASLYGPFWSQLFEIIPATNEWEGELELL